MNDAFKGKIDSDNSNLESNPSIRGLSRREAIERIGKHAVYTVPTIGVIVSSEEIFAQREDRAARGFRRRIGFNAGQIAIEGALAFAAKNGFHFVDFNADRGANDLGKWGLDRVKRFRATCEANDLHVGIHTRSGVNVAEFAPFVSEAVDKYLRANVDLAVRLGCDWVIVHTGFHFSSAKEARKAQALDRLKRLAGYAEQERV